MKNCQQTDTQNVYEHGLSVWEFTQKILNKEWDDINVPTWLSENYEFIIDNICSISDIKLYNIFHDCGKPYCIEIDEEGRRHFPDHANVSKRIWDEHNDNQVVSTLIEHDMMFHTATADEIVEKNLPLDILLTLLVTALAEVHSNAQMFGGRDSVSFKMKYKKIVKRGNMVFRRLV